MVIGELFHVAHVVDDLAAAEAWYDAVFAPVVLFHRHESPLDHRTASLLLVADFPVEPMAPHPGPAGEAGTIGRFRRRFGTGLHSLAFYCDSVAEGYERFRALGIRVTGDGGVPLEGPPARGGIYTHPRDSFGLIELMEPRVAGTGGAPVGDTLGECYDPRLLGRHDASRWEHGHPLGLRRTSHLTVVVDDLDRALQVYVDALQAVPFHEAATSARASVWCLVGPSTVVELARPREGTEEADALARDGAMLRGVTFLVRDLDAAAAHLEEATPPATTLRREGDRLVLDPGCAFGARYAFVDHPVPGDPRP